MNSVGPDKLAYAFLSFPVWKFMELIDTNFAVFQHCYQNFECTEANIQVHVQFPSRHPPVCVDVTLLHFLVWWLCVAIWNIPHLSHCFCYCWSTPPTAWSPSAAICHMATTWNRWERSASTTAPGGITFGAALINYLEPFSRETFLYSNNNFVKYRKRSFPAKGDLCINKLWPCLYAEGCRAN